MTIPRRFIICTLLACEFLMAIHILRKKKEERKKGKRRSCGDVAATLRNLYAPVKLQNHTDAPARRRVRPNSLHRLVAKSLSTCLFLCLKISLTSPRDQSRYQADITKRGATVSSYRHVSPSTRCPLQSAPEEAQQSKCESEEKPFLDCHPLTGSLKSTLDAYSLY